MAKQKEKDPCWSSYEQAGTKKKYGKTVSNCIKSEKKPKAKVSKLKAALSPSIKKTFYIAAKPL